MQSTLSYSLFLSSILVLSFHLHITLLDKNFECNSVLCHVSDLITFQELKITKIANRWRDLFQVSEYEKSDPLSSDHNNFSAYDNFFSYI